MTARISAVQSAARKMMAAMTACTDAQFRERIDIINKLVEIWSNGEDVDLKCNEQEELSINDTHQRVSPSVPLRKVPETRPVAKYKPPVMPRRKPGEAVVPFSCSVCQKSFRFYSQLEQHSRHHTGVRPYECNVCGQSFAFQCSLVKHTTSHSNEKPLMCDTCGQRFAHINYLRSHQRTHQAERPYSCQECDKRFKSPNKLRHHIAVRHSAEISDDTKRHFTCHICGIIFSTIDSVRQHLRSHCEEDANARNNETTTTPSERHSVDGCHTCNYCGRLYSTLAKLRRHIATHSNDKKHECEICGRLFLQLTSLKTHMNTHSGLKPFVCNNCSRKFSDRSTLRKHMLKHCPLVDTDRVKSDSVFDGLVTTMTMLESGEVGNDVDLNLHNDDVNIFNANDGI